MDSSTLTKQKMPILSPKRRVMGSGIIRTAEVFPFDKDDAHVALQEM